MIEESAKKKRLDRIIQVCNKCAGKPVQLFLHDGEGLTGVIKEVKHDGIIFGPLDHPSKANSSNDPQPELQTSGFFIPFAAITALAALFFF
ncbi:hypothetical protein [Laceyella putida]|uniref:Uncharacterized protein n=1 Tax=Laceyella putida TaxID=110101 RepID=A0ABW2RL09_9BACL